MLSLEKQNEIKEILKISPLLLLNEVINDTEILNFCNNVLPFSVGIEIEANGSKLPYTLEKLYLISAVLGRDEQKFRIPNGYKGLLALELITNQLTNFLENTLSGNHYHIDCTNNFEKVRKAIFNSDILNLLDEWKYKGTYNRREIAIDQKGNWVNMRSDFKTTEIRIGELAFNYPVIYKRITEVSQIIKDIRTENNLIYEIIYDNNFSIEEISLSLNNALNIAMEQKNKEMIDLKNKKKEFLKNIIHSKPLNKLERIIKCY